jgi:hypothetical protein
MGKVMSDPPPATELIAPASVAAAKRIHGSLALMGEWGL